MDKHLEKTSEEKRGTVFDIQRYSIHDGPGIRTTVFMKGCPLRCLWCDNPESQRQLPEIAEFRNKCIGCGHCFKTCSVGALNKDKDWHIERDICNNCGECMGRCPAGARILMGKEVTVGEVMREIRKDTLFYENSGGGVTLTGGEPTAQIDFALELLRTCHKDYIHTAIETSGYVEWAELEVLLPHTDLIFLDLKQMDPIRHQDFTGISNVKILQNVEKLSRRRHAMIIRITLIPGYNDGEENMHATAKFLRDLPYTPDVEFLPYHRLGIGKYGALGRKYSLNGIRPLMREEAKKIGLVFEGYGVPVRKENLLIKHSLSKGHLSN